MSGGVDRDGESRREVVLLLALCLVTLAFWGVQYPPFLLPNNDYYSFERAAQSLAAFELPAEFKRLPAFPLWIALVTPLMPGPFPEMHAALVVNAAFAIGALVLLFVFARRAFGRGAFLVPLLFAGSVQFHAMGLQPLVEPSLGFFVILTCVLYQRRSPWQYAAGFVVGLGRAEAATIVPLLALLNWREDGRFWRHALLGGLASCGLLGWTALGSLYGSGQSFYLQLMEGMGWQPAPQFFWRVMREAFAFLYPVSGFVGFALLAVTAVPVVTGVSGGLRRFRRETILLLAFFVVSTGVVAVFGVNKARYAYTSLWIPQLFCAYGLVCLGDRATRRLADRLGDAPWPGLCAFAAWLGVLSFWLVWMQTRPHLGVPALDAAYTLVCVALAAITLLPDLGTPRRLRMAAALLALAFVTASVGSGVARKKTVLYDIHYANYGSWLLANWLHTNTQPDERMIALGKKHLMHVRPIERSRLLAFSKVPAGDVSELADFMRREGFSLVAWTHRGQPDDPSSHYYHELLQVELAAAFQGGGPVPGFEHVATLPIPEELDLDETPVQIYRVRP